MTKLSPFAKSSLDKVVHAHLAYRVARDTIEKELQVELENRLESYTAERDRAVRLADEAGVPRTQIGKAMGTTNYRTVQEILDRAKGISGETFTDSERRWSVTKTEAGWQLTIRNLGAGAVSGVATINAVNGEIAFVEGDAFVVPQIYRNNLAPEVLSAIS